ncbi:DUF6232 family protein [Dactylosporangium sp. NPDC049525]|uniref:DUF6232 family protein n=1 Tax=Dactylosporangium sp. NPDC049525 TaxID=3154730 RepID=UPI0034166D98
MPTFYRSNTVCITHRSFQVLSPDPVIHELGDLTSVWVVIPGASRGRVPVRIFGCGAPAALAALLAASPDRAVDWAFPLLVVGVTATLMVRSKIGPSLPLYGLMAMCSGAEICLYFTSDPVEFGQVRRALQRAIEWYEDTAR